MEVLPTEVISDVLSLLPVKDLILFGLTCHWMHDMSEDQYLWKQLVLRDFGKLYTLEDSEDFKKYWQILHISYLQTQKRLENPDYSCVRAAEDGDLLALQILHKRGYPLNKWVCSAAGKGSLECLKYAHEQECSWDKYTCIYAADKGHLECLKYAHEHGCPWDRWTCTAAAEKGHLEILKYAHEHGCPWDKWTCAYAAQGGHIECLEYARKHGCPEV